MSASEVLDDLPRLAREAAPEELPALLGRLAEAEAVARMRINAAAVPTSTSGNGQEAETWITPAQAARIAGVGRRTVYDWASGKSWASRPSRRCLRVAEGAFRRWLAAR